MASTKKTANIEKEVKTDEVQEATETIEVKASEEIENKTTDTVSEVIEKINKTIDEVAGTTASKKASRKVDIPLEEEIAVRSVTYGELGWICKKNNAHYYWSGIGEDEFIPFGDLITMNNTDQKFLTEPYLILKDERAVEYFRLAPLYEKLTAVDGLAELFKEGDLDKIENVLRNIRDTGMRRVAISRIKKLRETHVLNNIDIIHLVEKILCFDMA